MIFANISRLCEQRGISIARLEREVGLGNATIRNWLNSSPTIDSLKRVADYFDIAVDDLISPELPNQPDSAT